MSKNIKKRKNCYLDFDIPDCENKNCAFYLGAGGCALIIYKKELEEIFKIILKICK